MIPDSGTTLSTFQSTPSARRATRLSDAQLARLYKFQSTPSARRATGIQQSCPLVGGISIHALREEGDHLLGVIPDGHADFNPRPPRGGRHRNYVAPRLTELFQSTPSARRATSRLTLPWFRGYNISIHALREEGDSSFTPCSIPTVTFQSTPSARRATVSATSGEQTRSISIHALREEGDSPQTVRRC